MSPLYEIPAPHDQSQVKPVKMNDKESIVGERSSYVSDVDLKMAHLEEEKAMLEDNKSDSPTVPALKPMQRTRSNRVFLNYQ